jgi:isocitrate dehydrogenase
LYWAQELAAQNDDQDLKRIFAPVAQELAAKADVILQELRS